MTLKGFWRGEPEKQIVQGWRCVWKCDEQMMRFSFYLAMAGVEKQPQKLRDYSKIIKTRKLKTANLQSKKRASFNNTMDGRFKSAH